MTIQLKNRSGDTVDVSGLTEELARAIGPTLAPGWAFSRPKQVTIDEVIGGVAHVAEAPKERKPREPITPAFIEAVTARLMPGDSLQAFTIASDLRASVEDVSRALGVLKAAGKATVSGRGRGAKWAAKVPGVTA